MSEQTQPHLDQALTKLLVESAADSIVTIDQNGIIKTFNTTAERMFGYSANEIIGKNVSVLMGGSYSKHHDGYIKHYIDSGKENVLGMVRELFAKRKSGETFPVEIAVSEVRNGNAIIFASVIRDISDRKINDDKLKNALSELKVSQQKVEKSERQLHHILDTSSAGVAILRYDPLERIFANKRFLEMFGARTLDELNAHDYRSTFVNEEDFVHTTSGLANETYDRRIMERRRLDGTTWWSLVDALAIEFEEKPAVIVWYFDISHQKKAEQELVQAEKMASLGGLVAGVAHEVNTPLGVCVTAATFLGEKVDKMSASMTSGNLRKTDLEDFLNAAKQSSSIITANLETAANLVRSFKQVAVDQSSEQARTFKLLDYLDEVMHSLLPRLKKTSHKIVIEGDRDITLTSYPGAVSQILTNFIMNSLIHAYDEGESGNIKVVANQSDDFLHLQYSDDGKGLSPEVKNRIFDPFFTTTRGSGGSGLGMNIVYNLITQKLGGTITCESSPGEGVRFIVAIPLTQDHGA